MRIKDLLSICENKFELVIFDKDENLSSTYPEDLLVEDLYKEFKTFEVDNHNSSILFNL